jgi:hypothetical protein
MFLKICHLTVLYANLVRVCIQNNGSRAEKCFDIVHSDVWGISLVISHARYKYFVTFIDDFSRYTWVYFLQSKSEVFCFSDLCSIC